MYDAQVNLCEGCHLNCCISLQQIKLSRAEYEHTFAPFEDQVEVLGVGKVVELSMRDGQPCPHFDEQCQDYGGRPMECALFPFSTGTIHVLGPVVIISYHSDVPCPKKEHVIISHAEAREMIQRWAKGIYGEDHLCLAVYQGGLYKLISRARRLVRSASGRS